MKKLILLFSILSAFANAQDVITTNHDTINVGQSATLSDTHVVSTSYLWSNGATTQNIIVTPSATTRYSVTRTTEGVADTGSVLVVVDTASPQLGSIFSDSFNTNTSANWTAAGTSTFTFDTVNGNLLCSGGTADFSKYIGYNKWATCLEQHTITAYFKITTTPSSTSGGIWFGIRSINPKNRVSYACFYNCTNTAGWGGHSFIYSNSNTLATTFVQRGLKSSTGSIPHLNDEIKITVTRNFMNVTVQTINLTTHDTTTTTANDSLSYPTTIAGWNNTGYVTIWLNGGSQAVHSVDYSSIAHKNIKTLNVSASIGHGFYAGGYTNANRYTTVGYTAGGTHEVSAGGSDRTWEVLARMPEILLQNPKYLLLEIGCNDIYYGGFSQAQINTNYDAIRNAVVGAGITIIHLYATPFNAKDITPINTHIASAWSSDWFVDDYTPLWSGSGTSPNPTYYSSDLIHPNTLGHSTLANGIVTKYSIIK